MSVCRKIVMTGQIITHEQRQELQASLSPRAHCRLHVENGRIKTSDPEARPTAASNHSGSSVHEYLELIEKCKISNRIDR